MKFSTVSLNVALAGALSSSSCPVAKTVTVTETLKGSQFLTVCSNYCVSAHLTNGHTVTQTVSGRVSTVDHYTTITASAPVATHTVTVTTTGGGGHNGGNGSGGSGGNGSGGNANGSGDGGDGSGGSGGSGTGGNGGN